LCARGHPNLCENLRFCGTFPDEGALCQWIRMPGRTCFPLPPEIDDAEAVMLEPLGVAIHAADLAKLRVARSVAILGAGPIGLCILQVVRLSGSDPIFVTDKFPWRLDLARRLGATKAFNCDELDPVEAVRHATGARGVDVAIEAAWCDRSLDQAAGMLVMGGRLVVAGISDDDRMTLKHSVARRKGLSIIMVRRMKHAYPRAIRLARSGAVQLGPLVTHRFPLQRAGEAFALNADYGDGVVKALVEL
jgi:L-iditol 2-dehydrogenase